MGKLLKRRTIALLSAPGIAFIIICCTYPVLSIIAQTFIGAEGNLTLSGYWEIFQMSFFNNSLARTMKLSLITTFVCAVVGLPVSFYISRLSAGRKSMAISLATFPLLTSAIVRSICWIVLLGKKGTFNNLLVGLGIIERPITMLYTEFSMLVGYIQLFMPLMLLSLVGVMESIDDELILASRTLGCGPIKAFAKVVLPLSVSGLITGSMLVFTRHGYGLCHAFVAGRQQDEGAFYAAVPVRLQHERLEQRGHGRLRDDCNYHRGQCSADQPGRLH